MLILFGKESFFAGGFYHFAETNNSSCALESRLLFYGSTTTFFHKLLLFSSKRFNSHATKMHRCRDDWAILDGFWNGTLLDKRWNHSIRHNGQGCRWSNKEFSLASGWLQLVLWKILEQLFLCGCCLYNVAINQSGLDTIIISLSSMIPMLKRRREKSASFDYSPQLTCQHFEGSTAWWNKT